MQDYETGGTSMRMVGRRRSAEARMLNAVVLKIGRKDTECGKTSRSAGMNESLSGVLVLQTKARNAEAFREKGRGLSA